MIFNVKEFGAVGDGITVDTNAIQESIDTCSSLGGGEVFFPSGIFLTGTLIIKDNVMLRIDKNCIILGSSDFEDYKDDISLFKDAVGQQRGRCLIFAEGASNIGITGEGTIHGRGEAFNKTNPDFAKRPFVLRMTGCRNVSIEGVTFRNSPSWSCHCLDCEDVNIKNVKIISRVNVNNDGIDVDSCKNVNIENCYIDTGDDGICLKSTIDKPCENINVSNSLISSRWAAFKIGTESVGDFRNINVTDCCFYDTDGCGIKLVPVDGANLENVNINNIKMVNCTGPIFIALGERLRSYYSNCASKKESGFIKNIKIKGIRADVKDAEFILKGSQEHRMTKGCIVISGIKDKKIEDVVLEDLVLIMPGGGTEEEAKIRNIPEMGKNYPEFYSFGILPSYGFYVRHANGLKIKNINLTLRDKDKRYALFCEKSSNIAIEEITVCGDPVTEDQIFIEGGNNGL